MLGSHPGEIIILVMLALSIPGFILLIVGFLKKWRAWVRGMLAGWCLGFALSWGWIAYISYVCSTGTDCVGVDLGLLFNPTLIFFTTIFGALSGKIYFG